MARWEVAYEHQMDLWKFWRSPFGHSYASGFLGDMRKKGKIPPVGVSDFYDRFADYQEAVQFSAEPVYIASDMMELWKAAAEQFEPEPLEASDLLTPTGFVYFPEPMIVLDAFGKQVATRAFSWHRSVIVDTEWTPEDEKRGYPQNGILITLYSHIDDDDDYTPQLRGLDTALNKHPPFHEPFLVLGFW